MKLRKGISTVEYAVLIAVLIAALVGISVYMKRAICGRWREGGDEIGYGRQYDPPY